MLLCSSLVLSAQNGHVHFENISATLGRLHNPVDFILEDHLGFLWFAAETGLFQYDGYRIREFGHDIYDTLSLSSPTIWHIAEDDHGRIWIATTYGINLFDRHTRTFKRFIPFREETSTKEQNTIRWLHFDRDQRLWVAGFRKLFLFDEESGLFHEIRDREHVMTKPVVHTITESSDGTLWCGTNDGLLKILPGDTVFSHIRPHEEPDNKFNKSITGIEKAGNGDLWLATSGGLALYAPEVNRIQTAFEGYHYTFPVSALTRLQNGRLWLVFRSAGVGMYDPVQGVSRHFVHDDAYAGSLHNNHVRCIREDQFQNIWLGTTTGVSKIRSDRSGIELIQNVNGTGHHANHVQRILEDREGTVWMKTPAGIYTRAPEEVTGHPAEAFSGTPLSQIGDWIYQDRAGRIWMPEADGGLMMKDAGKETFRIMPADSLLKKSVVYKIVGDGDDPHILWIGTSEGLCEYDTRTNTSRWHYPLAYLPELPNNRVSIFEDYGNEIWLYYTYYNSLGRFSKETGRFEIFRPPTDEQYVLEGSIKDIAISSDGNVWLASIYGLTRFDPKTLSYQIYTTRDGLDDNALNAVVIDQMDRVWVAGNEFLAGLDRASGTFRTVVTAGPVNNFWSKSRFLADDGHIFFGGLNGVYAFHPDSLQENTIPPKVVLTEFKVKDSTYQLSDAFEYVDRIVLSHLQNDIVFEFAGIHYIAPEANRHRCMLEGYDQTWRNLGYAHAVNYTNLSPGQYTFRAQAANRDGVWSKEDLVIALVITPPFTQTGWFKALIGILLVLALYAVYRIWQYQQTLRREKEIAEQAAEYRMRFLSHVSHEIRTPMNAIIGLSGLTKETPLDGKQLQYVSAIEQSSQDLLSIINELLDHSKVESGMFTFVKQPFSLSVIIDQISTMFRALATEKGLDFSIEIDNEVPDALVGDGLRLGQILTNLLGNAVKYTSEGNVSLEISSAGGTGDDVVLQFEVSDTGAGIPEERLDQVFERFGEAPADIWSSGTGLGLYITRALVTQQGGNINVDSRPGSGTRVNVRMPFAIRSESASDAAASVPVFQFGPLHVLIVDDAPMNHLVLSEMLKKRIPHIVITTATDGQEAVDLLPAGAYDVIIMDAKMPGMDGLTATRTIRQMDGTYAGIPILGATAGAMDTQLQACLESGMDDVISKPVQIDVLVEKLFHLTQSAE